MQNIFVCHLLVFLLFTGVFLPREYAGQMLQKRDFGYLVTAATGHRRGV